MMAKEKDGTIRRPYMDGVTAVMIGVVILILTVALALGTKEKEGTL
jgi:hypothetical protein